MKSIEQVLTQELSELLEEIAPDVPRGTMAFINVHDPTLRSRIDEAEARLAIHRNELIAHYGSWRSAREDLQNLWSLAGWKARQPGAAEALEEAA